MNNMTRVTFDLTDTELNQLRDLLEAAAPAWAYCTLLMQMLPRLPVPQSCTAVRPERSNMLLRRQAE